MIGGSQGSGDFAFPDGQVHRWARNMWYTDSAGEDEITFFPPIQDEDADDFATELVYELCAGVGNAQADASYAAMTAVCPTDPPQAVTE
jgi:hypothetical protein